jgi:chromosome segregation ATPase
MGCADATKRGDKLKDEHAKAIELYNNLVDKHEAMEAKYRDAQDKLVSQSSLLEQQEADSLTLRAQVEELMQSKEQHIRALDQARVALQATSARATEVDMQHERAQERIKRLEADVAESRGELETRNMEVEAARSRLTEVENSWAKSREEADAFRALTTTSLGELLDSHRDLKADEDRLGIGHAEKIQALEAEAQSLRLLWREVSQRADEGSAKLVDERKRVQEQAGEMSTLQAQMVGLRGQLAGAIGESVRLKAEVGVLERTVKEKSKEARDAQAKLGMLRNYLAENGVIVDDDDMEQQGRGSAVVRDDKSRTTAVADLESKLVEKTRLHENAERELEKVLRQKRDVEVQVTQLTSRLDSYRSTPTNNTGSAAGEVDERLQEAEDKLEMVQQAHQQKIKQLEDDYNMAVHYVKCVFSFLILHMNLMSLTGALTRLFVACVKKSTSISRQIRLFKSNWTLFGLPNLLILDSEVSMDGLHPATNLTGCALTLQMLNDKLNGSQLRTRNFVYDLRISKRSLSS